MKFDVEGARKAGYTDAEIADHLAGQSGFDVAGARSSGYADGDIIQHLTAKKDSGALGVARDLAAGAVRGAGSIGATILWPVDKITDMVMGDRGPGIKGLVTGQQPMSRNEERRAAMDNALAELVGADTESTAYGIGKLGGEIAGTAGAGGAAANVLGRIGAVSRNAPNLLQAISTAGMKGGNMATRSAGGAITGALAAGMTDPEAALSGGAIGAAAPGAMKLAGMAGNKIGALVRGPAADPDLINAARSANQAGFVIPPTQVKPSLANRLLEGFSGKITTAQNASARNQGVTNNLVAKELGLPAGTKLTPDVLDTVRANAGKAYEAVASTGTVNAGPAYSQALDAIVAPLKKAAQGFPNAKASPLIDEIESLKSSVFDASAAVEKVKELRDLATKAYGQQDKAAGKAYKAAAGAIEDALETHLQSIGAPADMLKAFRESRQLIAKTYSAQAATNAVTGSVDARKLASQLQKGKPLSGGIRDAAEFGARFPKAAQPIEGMGSLPQTSPLDWGLGAGISALTSNPMMLASVLARPAARAATLSPMVQSRLASQPVNALQMLANPEIAQLLYRAAPVAGAGQ